MFKKKSTYKITLITSTILLSVACSTAQNYDDFKPISVINEPVGNQTIYFDELVQSKTTASFMVKNKPKLTEAETKDLIEFFKKKPNKANIADEEVNLSRSQVKEALVSGNFSDLEDVDHDKVTRVVSKLDNEALKKLIEQNINENKCANSSLYLALAASGERFFPDSIAVQNSTELYKKTYNCKDATLKAKAAYRLALFSIGKNQCQQALGYWPAVLSSPDVRYLHSRAYYWKTHCENELSLRQKTSDKAYAFFSNFPLSFHSIQIFKENNIELSDIIFQKTSPKVLVRTEKNSKINLMVNEIENAIEVGDFEKASRYLYVIKPQTEETEAHFKLYLAYLGYLAKDGLNMIQYFSRAFSQYPELKTKSTLQLFYPDWYFADIEKQSKVNDLDPFLVISLVRQESAFNSSAKSGVGARGLMQLMPATARTLDRSVTKNDLYDVNLNIRLGTQYFSQLVTKYNGNVAHALAAYNAGFGNVNKWVKRYPVTDPILFSDLIPFRETREYVGSILRNKYWYQALNNVSNDGRVKIGMMAVENKK